MNSKVRKEETQSYSVAMGRLKAIVEQIEGAEVEVDALEKVVQEAVLLINQCKARLTATQLSVDEALNGLKQGEKPVVEELEEDDLI